MAKGFMQQQLDDMAVEGARLKQIEQGFEKVLDGLGFDWKNDPHMQKTPERAARAWYYELCSGQTGKEPVVTTFPHTGDTGMVILKDIPVKSLCAHHLLPYIGKATVGYVGEHKLVGLSKLSRIVDFQARRPSVQEQLTTGVANHLWELIQDEMFKQGKQSNTGVAVIVRSSHMCMALRGVNHSGEMVTSAIRGVFEDPEVRAEFLTLAGER